MPTMLQGSPTKTGFPSSPTTVARLLTFWPSIDQIWDSPVELLCHRMSLALATWAIAAMAKTTSVMTRAADTTHFLCFLAGSAVAAAARQRDGAPDGGAG